MGTKIYSCVCACLLLWACSPADDGVLLPLEVSAEVASVLSRTVDATNYDKLAFETGDEISIVLKGGSSSVTYKRGQSGWLPATSGSEGLTTTGNQTFVATYPATFTSILADQTSYGNFWLSNRLSSEATARGNKVSFSFAPTAAKITIVVTYDANKTAGGATVAGAGIRTNGSSSETVSLLNTSGSATPRRQSYTGIIYPGTARLFTITVKNTGDSDRTYAQKTSLNMKAGYNYLYTFSSSNELILTGVTVTPFTDQTVEEGGSAT